MVDEKLLIKLVCLEGLPASGCLDVSENEEGITKLCVCDTDECNDSFDALNR